MKSLLIRVLVDAAGVGPAFAKVSGEADAFGKSVTKSANQSTAAHKVFKGAIVASAGAIGVLGVVLDKSVHAAMNAQASEAGLEQALRRTHQSVEAMTPALSAAEAAARKLGFTDEDTAKAMARMEIATGSTKKTVEDLSVAEDLARTRHMDLATATNAMAQAMTGSQRAAKQLGIIVLPVTTNLDALKASTVDLTTATGKAEEVHAKLLDKMATGQAVIDATNAKVHGQAQAFANTAAGGMAQFQAQMEHLEVTLGSALLPALTSLATMLANVTGFLAQHTTAVKIAILVLASLATAVLAVAAGEAIVAAATTAWTAGQWLLNAALDANPIGLVVIGLAALGVGLYEAWTHSATFRDVVTAAFNAVKTVVATVITDILRGIDDFLAGIEALAKAAGHIPFVGSKFDGVAEAVGRARDQVQALSDAINGVHDKTITLTVLTSGTNLFGTLGARAGGGPVSAGTPYLVGEQGPELFMPESSGMIVPHASVASGGGTVINNYIAGSVVTEREIFEIAQKYAKLDVRSGGLGVPG